MISVHPLGASTQFTIPARNLDGSTECMHPIQRHHASSESTNRISHPSLPTDRRNRVNRPFRHRRPGIGLKSWFFHSRIAPRVEPADPPRPSLRFKRPQWPLGSADHDPGSWPNNLAMESTASLAECRSLPVARVGGVALNPVAKAQCR